MKKEFNLSDITNYDNAWECKGCGMMNYEDSPCRDCEFENYIKWKEREELKEEIAKGD